MTKNMSPCAFRLMIVLIATVLGLSAYALLRKKKEGCQCGT